MQNQVQNQLQNQIQQPDKNQTINQNCIRVTLTPGVLPEASNFSRGKVTALGQLSRRHLSRKGKSYFRTLIAWLFDAGGDGWLPHRDDGIEKNSIKRNLRTISRIGKKGFC